MRVLEVSNLDGFYAVVGGLIGEARERRNVAQEALASLVLLSRTSLTNIERGRQKVRLHTLCRLAAALEVTPCRFLPNDVPELADAVGSHNKNHPWRVGQREARRRGERSKRPLAAKTR